MLKLTKLSIMVGFLVMGLGFSSIQVFAQESSTSSDSAHKAIVKIYAYHDDRDFSLKPDAFGSGMIIDPSGLVLTNYHVIGYSDEPTGNYRWAAYQICLTTSMDAPPSCDYVGQVAAEDRKMDLALLRIMPQPGLSNKTTFPFLPIDYAYPFAVNDAVTAMGYPDIGGETITVTQGKIIGKETASNQKWLKTDAVISLGSSGGALLNSQGKMIGMTTAVKSDLNALGYVIDIGPFQAWIEKNKNNKPKNDYLNRLLGLMKEQAGLNTSEKITIRRNGIEVTLTRPQHWTDTHSSESLYNFYDTGDPESGAVAIDFLRIPYKFGKKALVAFLKNEAPLLKIKTIKQVKLHETPAFFVSLTNKGNFSEFYYIPTHTNLIKIDWNEGRASKDKKMVADMIDSIRIDTRSNRPMMASNHLHSLFTVDLTPKAAKDWYLHLVNNNGNILEPNLVELYNPQYPDAIFKITVINLQDVPEFKDADNKAILKSLSEYFVKVSKIADLAGVSAKIMESNKDFQIQGRSFIDLKVSEKIDNKFADYLGIYAIKHKDAILRASFVTLNKSKKVIAKTDQALVNLLENFVTLKD